jgi:hypothetical protein
VLLNPAVLVESGLSDVLGAIGHILLSYLVHMHGCLRSLGQGQVHVGPITWEVLPHERPHASASPVLFPARATLSKRALVLPFIGVRRGSRCTMGGVAECYVSSGGELAP